MKYKFALIKNHLIKDSKPYWMCLLSNLSDYHIYFLHRTKHETEAYMDLKRRLGKHRRKEEQTGKKRAFHYGSQKAHLLNCIFEEEDRNGANRKTLMDDMEVLGRRLVGILKKPIQDGKQVLVNVAGGWCPVSESMEILDVIEKDEFVFPMDERDKEDWIKMINILQWGNGMHYYAKLGDVIDVVVNGNQKWDSYKEAYDNAIIFISERLEDLNKTLLLQETPNE